MSTKINFTKASLEALTPPKGPKRNYYYDTKIRGLALSVTAYGTKTFFLYRKISGRPEKITLGRLEDLSVEQARNRATQLNAQIAGGENPADKRRVAREEMTLGELFEQYLARHARLNTKWWRQGQALFRRYCETSDNGGLKLADRRISTIMRAHIAQLHSNVSREFPITANRTLAQISSIFGWAIKAGLWDKTNPAIGIAKNKERARDRFLQADELPRFFEALAQETNGALRDYVLLSLLTGARQMNVLSMTWDQVNFQNALWHIPETKNGTPHTVPLTKEALEVLQARRLASVPGQKFVFAAPGKRGYFADPNYGWRRLLKRADIANLRLHDLRRTLGSWQASTGASLTIIGKTLNHKHPSSTAIYARLSVDPVRKSLETANAAMFAAAGISPTAELIQLKQRPVNKYQ